jgi:hypothetical protein
VGVCCYLRRVSTRQLDALVADKTKLSQVLFPSSTETAIDDDVWIDIGEDWQGLSDELVKLNPAMTLLVSGGKDLGVLGGGRPARGFASDETRRIAAALSLLTPERVPEAHAETFGVLKAFVTETAKAAAGMIVFWR